MNPDEYIQERQHSWALRHGVCLDEVEWAVWQNDNLFLPLIQQAIQEFGQEYGGRMRAPHSSTALVANVFHYWRLYNEFVPILSAISPALTNYQVQDLRFEVRCPIAWPIPGERRPPQPDVVIRYRDLAQPDVIKGIAIESKFGELYGQDQGPFANSYVAPENEPIWNGYEPLREVAIRINQGEQNIFQRLKVSQLIKHILGLNNEFKGTQNFELIYLWYPAPGPQAVDHEEEIKRFEAMAEKCEPPVNFRAIKYHDLIHALTSANEHVDGTYLDYLVERYF